MQNTPLFTFILLSILSFTALSDETSIKLNDNQGWYIGILAGSSSQTEDMSTRYKNKSAPIVAGIYWGVNFVDWLGLESTIVTANDVVEKKGPLLGSSYTLFSITPKINLQLHTRFSLFAKAGYTYFSYTEKYESDTDSSSIFDDDDDIDSFFSSSDDNQSWSSILPMYSLGGEFRIIRGLEARLTFDHVEGNLSHSTTIFSKKLADIEVDLNIITLSAHYQF